MKLVVAAHLLLVVGKMVAVAAVEAAPVETTLADDFARVVVVAISMPK